MEGETEICQIKIAYSKTIMSYSIYVCTCVGRILWLPALTMIRSTFQFSTLSRLFQIRSMRKYYCDIVYDKFIGFSSQLIHV